MTRSDAWRIMVVVFGSGCGYAEERRAILCGRTEIVGDDARAYGIGRAGWRSVDTIAGQPRLKLLVGAESGDIHGVDVTERAIGAVAAGARRRTSDQAAVVPPVEAEPGALLPRLILHVSGGIEFFVVINAERTDRSRNCAGSPDLRTEEAGGHAGKDH